MSIFGYSLSPRSNINLDSVDYSKLNLLIEQEPDILKCMECGSCTATCSSGVFTSTSFRKAIHQLKNGQEKEAISLLESCMLCGKCNMVCPRAINTRHLIVSICNIYNNERENI